MQAPLLEALGRLWRSFWGRRPRVAVETKDRDWAGARGRFWTEFREGQREAEAYISSRTGALLIADSGPDQTHSTQEELWPRKIDDHEKA